MPFVQQNLMGQSAPMAPAPRPMAMTPPAPQPAPRPMAMTPPPQTPQMPRAQIGPGALPQQAPPMMGGAQRPGAIMQPGAQAVAASPPPPAPAPPAPAPAAPPPPMQPLPSLPPAQSIEQQALNGGGASNKQQIQNFMQALNGVGAGSNNTFMNAPQAPANVPMTNLVQPLNGAIPGAGSFNPGGAGPMGPGLPRGVSPMPHASFGPGLMQQGGMQSSPSMSSMLPSGGGQQAPFPHPLAQSVAPNMIPQTQPLLSHGALMSDQTQKQEIEPAQQALHDFMGQIGAHNYTYKDPRDGVGTFTSPMAQELEKTELGKQAVINTPRGKMVDYGRLGGVNLAGLSVVHREQQKLAQQVARLREAVRRKK